MRLIDLLAQQHYRTVLYVADTPASSQWTLTCIRQVGQNGPSWDSYLRFALSRRISYWYSVSWLGFHCSPDANIEQVWEMTLPLANMVSAMMAGLFH